MLTVTVMVILVDRLMIVVTMVNRFMVELVILVKAVRLVVKLAKSLV